VVSDNQKGIAMELFAIIFTILWAFSFGAFIGNEHGKNLRG